MQDVTELAGLIFSDDHKNLDTFGKKRAKIIIITLQDNLEKYFGTITHLK